MSDKTEPETFNVVVDMSKVNDKVDALQTQVKTLVEAMGENPGKGIVENQKPTYEYKKDIEPFFNSKFKNYDAFVKEAIGEVDPDSAMPEIWSTDIEKTSLYPASVMLSGNVVNWKRDVQGKPGDIVNVPTVGPVSTADITSGDEPTFTAATVAKVAITLVQKGHGYYISKDDLDDAINTLLPALNDQSGRAIASAVDGYFLTSIQAADTNAGAGTINEAGAMAATCLAKMWGSLTAGTYEPGVVLMHPIPYASLLQDSQFTNAATWGDTGVSRTGKIPNYLGMDIYPLIQGTLKATSGGTYRTYVLAKGALCGALKRGVSIEKEYYVKDQRNYVVTAIRFGGTVVHTNGIGLITTVNG